MANFKILKIIIIFFAFFLLLFLYPFKTAAAAQELSVTYYLSGNDLQIIYLPGPSKINKVNVYACSVQNRNGGFQLDIGLLYEGAQVAYKGTLRYSRSGCPMWSGGGTAEGTALDFGGTSADAIRIIPVVGTGSYYQMIVYYEEGYIPPVIQCGASNTIAEYFNFSGGNFILPTPVKIHLVNAYACSRQNRRGGYRLGAGLLYNSTQVAYKGTAFGGVGNELAYSRSGCPMWAWRASPPATALNFGGIIADTISINPIWGRGGIGRIFYTHEAPECNLSHKTCQGNSCVVISGAGADQCSDDASCAPPPPPTVDLTSWPTWELPEPIHLKWTSTNADSCVASGDWSGNKPTSGDEYLSKPRGTYTFILTCTGPGGSASDTATTKVIQVPRCTFTANPTSIILPQSSTLSWSCQYADTCSIDQGIGSVNNVSGTKQVRSPQTTTYTLSCSGLDGSRSYPATVNVGFVPWIKEVIPR